MLLAIAPAIRKDIAQSAKGVIKATHDQAESCYTNTSTLVDSSNDVVNDALHRTPVADVVTNKDRAKSAEATRVLSPMRPRRTPVLVNAPDIKWRLAPYLRHIPSLDSVLSTSTTSVSEASTVHPTPISPHNIALPSPVTSSLLTVMSEETNPVDTPLPLSPPPPPPIDTRFNEPIERPRPGQGHYLHQPHLLSPVTEASSAPSITSSIVDLDVQDIATAECYDVNHITRQNVQVVGASQVSLASQQSRQSRFIERFSLEGEGHYADSLRSGGQNGTPVMSGAYGSGDKDMNAEAMEVQDKRRVKTICGRIEKLKKSMRGFGSRVGQCVARKLGTLVLARGVGSSRFQD